MTGTGRAGAAWGGDWSASRRRGSEDELDGWLAFALEVATEADAIALRGFRSGLATETKADGSFVTEADRAVERLVRDRIADRYPDHGIVGEEEAAFQADASVRWYVDPIDGTHNFMRGVPLFGTLMACERDGELQVGVLSAPALGERWFARRGGGAWSAGTGPAGSGAPRRMAVSAIDSIARSQLLFSSLPDLERTRLAPGVMPLLRSAWRSRGFGDFWGYALVADGSAEAMVETDVSVWDLAAPVILVEEAGGRFTDLAGERRFDTRTMLVTNGLLHDEILARLHEAPAAD
ncbi:MAG: histidinol-phosphatase [Chloroflexi bacterium]|jgi:histidinol-phosphatase|nr:histidinol-phosphatase [Chloroflexota bacterium]